MLEMFSIDDIKELMQAMNEHKIGVLEIEEDDIKIKLQTEDPVFSEPISFPNSATSTNMNEAAFQTEQPLAAPVCGDIVTSPIVGTFYTAPSPDKPNYVSIGSNVKKGDTLFIIESMKLMNEVTSELDGVISAIYVENGQAVEYGQPILIIE